MKDKFTIGADVEYILKPAIPSVYQFVSAENVIGGDKNNPIHTPLGNVHEDNVLAEMAINYADDLGTFIQNIKGMLGYLGTIVSKVNCMLSTEAACYMPEIFLNTENALKFSCTPDYDAYTGFRNPPINGKIAGNFRCAGGHIHVGHEHIRSEENMYKFVQRMDVLLGLPSVLLDNDRARRRLYGLAGSFRRKPYGVEYRTLSNFWSFDDNTVAWVYSATERALFDRFPVKNPELVRQAINLYDKKLASELLQDHFVEFPMRQSL